MTTQPRVDRTGGEDATRSHGRLSVAKSRPAPDLRPPSTSVVELHGMIGRVVRPEVSARDLIRVVIAPSVVDLLENLPIAREDKDTEGVHQARVAIRKIRSNLQTYESLLGREWARGIRSDLAPLASDLGRVRDDDVLDCRLRRLVELHPEILSEHMAELFAVLSEQRLLDRMSLIARLDEPSTAHLLNRLVVEAVDVPGRPAIDAPATGLFEPVLRKRWRRLERAVDALPTCPEFDELHRVRILTKRVRYASEAVAPALGRKAKRFARAAANLQDQLGELNDAAVTRAWLSGVSPVLTGPAAFSAGQLSQQLAGESSPTDHAWRKTYRVLEKRFDSWLG